MDCHDVQMLLSFAQRNCENLDAAERDALQLHLEKCPDCAALGQVNRRMDDTLSQIMQEVPIPTGLKAKILQRLTAERDAQPHRWSRGLIGIAASLLLLVGGSVAWYHRPLPQVTLEDVKQINPGHGWDESMVEQYFHERDLQVRVPRSLDYRFLQHVDVVEFKGRRVAKMTFSRLENDHMAIAHLLILSNQQFVLNALADDSDIRGINSIRVLREQDESYTYLIFYRGEFEKLLRDQV